MKRVSLTDGSGVWFDADKATKFEEERWHNGSNWISKATGTQWHHENMYRTASGKWILNTWSNYQGVAETFTQIDPEEVAKWFAKQGFSDKDIPEQLHELVSEMEM